MSFREVKRSLIIVQFFLYFIKIDGFHVAGSSKFKQINQSLKVGRDAINFYSSQYGSPKCVESD